MDNFPLELKIDILPDAKDAIWEVDGLDIKAVAISDHDGYLAAGDALKTIKALAKRLEAARKDQVKPLDAAKAEIQDFFRPKADLLASLEKSIKAEIVKYDDFLEDQRRKAEAEERERQRKERERLEAEAAERDRLKAEAEENGDDIDDLFSGGVDDTPIPVVPAIPVPETPKIEGASFRTKYTAEVVDVLALCRAIADCKIAPNLISVNQSALNKMASALEENFNIPGCKLNREKIMSQRTK